MALTNEQLGELYDLIVERDAEFDVEGQPMFEPLSRGRVRMLYQVIEEWWESDDTPISGDENDSYYRGVDDGFRFASEEVSRPDSEPPSKRFVLDIAGATGKFVDGAPTATHQLAPEPSLRDAFDGMVDSSEDAKDVAIERRRENEPEQTPNLVVGNPYYAEGNEEVVGHWPAASEQPALTSQTARTLGPEHTINFSSLPALEDSLTKKPLRAKDENTPLKAPIGRDRLPDPDVARGRLANAIAAGADGTLELLTAVARQPRALAEVDGVDDELPIMNRDKKAEQLRAIIYELQDMAVDEVMPSMAFWDSAKPPNLPKAQAITIRHELSWAELARYAKLTNSTKAKKKGNNP